MNEQTVDQSLNKRSNQRRTRKVRLGLLGVAVLLSLALGSAAMNYLVPKFPDRTQGVPDRLAWYLHHGQSHADVSTLAAALQFIMRSNDETPVVTNIANLPVAENAAPGAPKS